MRTQPGRNGHPVTIVEYRQPRGTGDWPENVVGNGVLRDAVADIEIAVEGRRPPRVMYLGIRVGVDTGVPADPYDDFLLESLSVRPGRYYASFGFVQSPAR